MSYPSRPSESPPGDITYPGESKGAIRGTYSGCVCVCVCETQGCSWIEGSPALYELAPSSPPPLTACEHDCGDGVSLLCFLTAECVPAHHPSILNMQTKLSISACHSSSTLSFSQVNGKWAAFIQHIYPKHFTVDASHLSI